MKFKKSIGRGILSELSEMKIFDSAPIKKFFNKFLLVFVLYIVAAASFNGFFVKWAFCDSEERYSFEMMFDETAHRPFVHRQLMLDVARGISSIIPDNPKARLIDHLDRHDEIGTHYSLSKIDSRYTIEYNLVYWMCFFCLLGSVFLWREIFIELTENKIAGTLAACCFAIIFPIFETVGGYFYDFGELLFFSLATFFALRGSWLALIIISPIAEYNKESFLFFVLTMFPFLAVKLGNKKAALTVIFAAFISGLTYLHVSHIYAGNLGGATEFHLMGHIEELTQGWLKFEFNYGVLMGQEMFLPHVLLVAWIVKNSWKQLPEHWKNHVKLAAAINVPLYLLFCSGGELRNLSMLYMGFIAMLAIFIKNFLTERSEGLID